MLNLVMLRLISSMNSCGRDLQNRIKTHHNRLYLLNLKVIMPVLSPETCTPQQVVTFLCPVWSPLFQSIPPLQTNQSAQPVQSQNTCSII